MTEIVAARSHRAVIVSIVVAAIAVTALALAGIAHFLGWLPRPASDATTASAPTRASTDGRPPAPEKLATREPLMPTYSQPTPPPPAPAPSEPEPERVPPVQAAPRKPAAPRYEPPDLLSPNYSPADPPRRIEPPRGMETPRSVEPPRRVEAPRPEPELPRIPRRESFEPAQPSRAAPSLPTYAQAPAPVPAPPVRPRMCENCGIVSAITTYPGLWEIRVRFEDGGTRTARFRSPPPFRIGERVRFEDGMLTHD